jgi:hypothetical protein
MSTSDQAIRDLSPTMVKALSRAQMDDDGELRVGWGGFVPNRTCDALRRRGLVNSLYQLTDQGKEWFNANVTD